MGPWSITKDAAEYENIMTTVRSILKATDNAITTFNQRFSDMSRNIRKVGVDTKFTTTEVAGAAKYLGMAGLNIEDINNSIKPIANLAIIGDAPLDRMADIVTNIQTAYGLDSSKMPQIADVLTSITTSTNTMYLKGEAMKFAAPMMSNWLRYPSTRLRLLLAALAKRWIERYGSGYSVTGNDDKIIESYKKEPRS